MKKLLIILLSLVALMSISSSAMAQKAGLWDRTKHIASTAAEWTVKKSNKGWETAKEGTTGAARWAARISEKGWQTAKAGAAAAAAWAAKKSEKDSKQSRHYTL